MSKAVTIPISEAPTWLAQHGRNISRQAVHQAVESGRLKPSRALVMGGKKYRWVKIADLKRLWIGP